MTQFRFHPRAWAFVLACAIFAGAVALGNWQRGRADEKNQLAVRLVAAEREPAIELSGMGMATHDFLWKRIAARGNWLPRHTVYLDNRMRLGRAGYEVLTPLQIESSSAVVLVNRGWIDSGGRRDRIPSASTPAGAVRIEGIAVPRTGRVYAPGEKTQGAVRLNLDIDDYRESTGLALLPFVIEQHSESGDGLNRAWPRAGDGAERNLMYAWQWYSLGVLAVVLFVVLSFRRHGT